MLASIEPGVVMIALSGMVFVLLLIGGICWYSWHEDHRKRAFKLQRERETTHREIAAYVAEGSITPADAEKLIRAMGETDERIRMVQDEAAMRAERGSERDGAQAATASA